MPDGSRKSSITSAIKSVEDHQEHRMRSFIKSEEILTKISQIAGLNHYERQARYLAPIPASCAQQDCAGLTGLCWANKKLLSEPYVPLWWCSVVGVCCIKTHLIRLNLKSVWALELDMILFKHAQIASISLLNGWQCRVEIILVIWCTGARWASSMTKMQLSLSLHFNLNTQRLRQAMPRSPAVLTVLFPRRALFMDVVESPDLCSICSQMEQEPHQCGKHI